MAKLQKILIMAGGTGGHVFPGLAVAKLCLEKQIQVHWLGTQQGLESALVPQANIPLHTISIQGLRGKGIKTLFMLPWRLTRAIFQAIKILKKIKPDLVLGMGGFVSGPGGIASWLIRCPLIIHEQNAKAGLTNRWLALIATNILQGFPDTFPRQNKVITTGNPIRHAILSMTPPEKRFEERLKKNDLPLHLLVIGGSLGAVAINQILPQALAKLSESERPLVIHQTGEKHYQETVSLYSSIGIKVELKPFITDMDQAYSWADIVLCRAGALTVAELCAAGLGAILIPFPFAVDDHQTANANVMVRNQAAWCVQQSELTPEKLVEFIKKLNYEREKCFLMAQSAYKSRKIDAAEQVLKICEGVKVRR